MTINGTMMQYFHWYYGNADNEPDLWEKVKQEVKNLSEIGITALWLPPPYKGTDGVKDVGYGIYDLYDLGEFNQKGSIRTKYGTKQQYLDAVKSAHENNIQVYGDVVFNHKAGADDTEWIKANIMACDDRNFIIENEVWIEAWTRFTFPGRNNMYSDFKWSYIHFDGVDYDQNMQRKAIYKFTGTGKEWAKMVSGQFGNYDYLMFSDIDMNHPEVRTELARWAKWFISTTQVDGFRLDAIKHIQFSFFRDWLNYIRREFPSRNIFAVGEYWSDNVAELLNYIEKTSGMMTLFDTPLQKNFYLASRSPYAEYDLSQILENTLVKADPIHAVTIIDNHDTQPCQSLERWVDWWFKPLAYALTLLRQEGYPCVFYADYYGAKYQDKGFNINLEPVPGLKELMLARKNFAYGPQSDYFDQKNVTGWTRQGDAEHPGSGMAVLISNGPGGKKIMELGMKYAGKKFYDFLGFSKGTVTLDSKGVGEFSVNSCSVSVWVQN